MARDYSKKNTSARSKKQKTGKPLKLVLLSFFIGYLTATLFSFDQLGQWLLKQKTAYLDKPAKTSKPVTEKKHVALPKPKFEFYTLLTKEGQSVVPARPVAPVTAAVPSVKPPVVKVEDDHRVSPTKGIAKASYMIQVASFRSKMDAERLKASLTLKDFDVRIVTVSQANGHWYRVITGPYPDKIKAENAQNSIARSEHMMGIIRKQTV